MHERCRGLLARFAAWRDLAERSGDDDTPDSAALAEAERLFHLCRHDLTWLEGRPAATPEGAEAKVAVAAVFLEWSGGAEARLLRFHAAAQSELRAQAGVLHASLGVAHANGTSLAGSSGWLDRIRVAPPLRRAVRVVLGRRLHF